MSGGRNWSERKMGEIDDMIDKLVFMFPQLSRDEASSQLLKRADDIHAQPQPEILLQSAIDHFLQHHGVPDSIECGCCCYESPFEKMVQCADGHLFCFQCLQKQVEEYTFGGMKVCSSLPCMDTSGCQESIPMSQVRRALHAEVVERYEQRQAQADIEQAKLDCLVYCPFCGFPCELDKGARVLECPNGICSKASCVQCKEPSHLPLSCEEVEKKSETALRRRIEEVMTQAVIRVCNSCKAEQVKKSGCNRVTCRCGSTMCYKCRQTVSKGYSHFCKHITRKPGRPCKYCKKCDLFEKEVNDKVVVAARDKALKKLAVKEPKLLRINIGPPIEIKRKSFLRKLTHCIC